MHSSIILPLYHVWRTSLLGIKSFFGEHPGLTKPIQLVSIGQDVYFDVYLECLQKSLGCHNFI